MTKSTPRIVAKIINPVSLCSGPEAAGVFLGAGPGNLLSSRATLCLVYSGVPTDTSLVVSPSEFVESLTSMVVPALRLYSSLSVKPGSESAVSAKFR